MKVHLRPVPQAGAMGAQVLRQTPGAAVPAQTLPGAQSGVELQASPVLAPPAGQTQETPAVFQQQELVIDSISRG